MFKHEKVLWITRTAVFIAATVALQALTVSTIPPPATQFVTGAIVNMMLILAVMTCKLPSGLTVAAVTPIMPTLLGFGPLWPIVPFIAVSNMVLVTAWHFIGNIKLPSRYISYIIALIVAAVAKFCVLYFGVVQIAIPHILGLPEGSAPHTLLSFMFSYPQLITASAGGVCAVILLPAIKKAVRIV
ncbi:MAG: hypothetical protein FWD44_07720 [Oscillospiraceae bacterium]|nr:hypothetical protein [Oscillospiraceae bacterium]